jgi:hypothetical protein
VITTFVFEVRLVFIAVPAINTRKQVLTPVFALLPHSVYDDSNVFSYCIVKSRKFLIKVPFISGVQRMESLLLDVCTRLTGIVLVSVSEH